MDAGVAAVEQAQRQVDKVNAEAAHLHWMQELQELLLQEPDVEVAEEVAARARLLQTFRLIAESSWC